MAAKLESIVARREALVLRAALQREELTVIYGRLEKQMWLPEAGFRVVSSLRRHPWMVGVASAVLGVFGDRLWKAPRRLWSVWKGIQLAYGFWKKF
jgi:YqjK-like protein